MSSPMLASLKPCSNAIRSASSRQSFKLFAPYPMIVLLSLCFHRARHKRIARLELADVLPVLVDNDLFAPRLSCEVAHEDVLASSVLDEKRKPIEERLILVG